MVLVAGGGIIFQAGVAWATLRALARRFDDQRDRIDRHDDLLGEHDRRLEDHHVRIRMLERE